MAISQTEPVAAEKNKYTGMVRGWCQARMVFKVEYIFAVQNTVIQQVKAVA